MTEKDKKYFVYGSLFFSLIITTVLYLIVLLFGSVLYESRPTIHFFIRTFTITEFIFLGIYFLAELSEKSKQK